MALVCPACGTENRGAARFCIECIAPLPTDFAPTLAGPPAGTADVKAYEGLPSVLAAFVSSRPNTAAAEAPPAASPTAPVFAPVPERRRGLWVSVAAFAIAMAIGAGGWLVAGAGGWYIYSSAGHGDAAGRSPTATATATSPASTLTATAPPAVAAAVPTRSAPRDSAPTRPSARPDQLAAPAPAKVVARGERRDTAAARAPSQVCGELNFIARARCMAAQCAAPHFNRHGECVAVREQQRLMESKRNPHLAD